MLMGYVQYGRFYRVRATIHCARCGVRQSDRDGQAAQRRCRDWPLQLSEVRRCDSL